MSGVYLNHLFQLFFVVNVLDILLNYKNTAGVGKIYFWARHLSLSTSKILPSLGYFGVFAQGMRYF